jgi:hypothetical protein
VTWDEMELFGAGALNEPAARGTWEGNEVRSAKTL